MSKSDILQTVKDRSKPTRTRGTLAAGDRKEENRRPVYDQIIDTIMKYYFFADVSYDFDEARATFERFLKTDVLQFMPV